MFFGYMMRKNIKFIVFELEGEKGMFWVGVVERLWVDSLDSFYVKWLFLYFIDFLEEFCIKIINI